jgi:hypothetical protein
MVNSDQARSSAGFEQKVSAQDRPGVQDKCPPPAL